MIVEQFEVRIQGKKNTDAILESYRRKLKQLLDHQSHLTGY